MWKSYVAVPAMKGIHVVGRSNAFTACSLLAARQIKHPPLNKSASAKTPEMLNRHHPVQARPQSIHSMNSSVHNRIPPKPHKITQHPPLSLFSKVSRAARVAASKTSSTPSPVRDEHSKYFLAPISRAVFVPSFSVVKCKDFLRISSCAIGSSRRSFFSPTSMMGTPGQRSLASSTH